MDRGYWYMVIWGSWCGLREDAQGHVRRGQGKELDRLMGGKIKKILRCVGAVLGIVVIAIGISLIHI